MKTIFRVIKWSSISILLLAAIITAYFTYIVMSFDTETLPENHGKVHTELFIGDGDKQVLIVGLGGSEGGNAWSSDYWKKQRDAFLEQGYAFLALGYFGMDGIPENLDRIALEGVYQAIVDASKHPKINDQCVAIIGGSKGAEFALLLGSQYPEIKAVVGIVPGHAVFASLTDAMTTSSFSLNGEALPFVPVPLNATPALLTGNLRGAFEKMLENNSAVEKAAIKVENINGAVLLLSATEDEMWPSSEMSELIIQRLAKNNFPHPYQHIAIDGNHNSPLAHFHEIEVFLKETLKSDKNLTCNY